MKALAEQPNHFETHQGHSYAEGIRAVARATYVLLTTPDYHQNFYEEVIRTVRVPIPTHAPLADELVAFEHLISRFTQERIPVLRTPDLLGYTSVLMQFTDKLPRSWRYAETPFDHVDKLGSAFAEIGCDQPLSYARQLEIALSQTAGDITEALWRLFITSRHYARWSDGGVLSGTPALKPDEIVDRMSMFNRSILAIKPHQPDLFQDTAGDTYYTWTHALGKVMFGTMASRESSVGALADKIVENGTRLMHTIVHTLYPQPTPTNHTAASEYGVAIGDALVNAIRSSDRESFK
jgi:hypothetical protein